MLQSKQGSDGTMIHGAILGYMRPKGMLIRAIGMVLISATVFLIGPSLDNGLFGGGSKALSAMPVDNAHASVILHDPGATDSPSTVLFLPITFGYQLVFEPRPATETVDLSPSTYFAWSITGGNDETYRYQVHMEANNSNPGILVADNLQTPYLDPATLEFDTRYHWRVTAINETGKAIVGPVWSFTTMPPPPNPPDIDSMRFVPGGEFQMGCYQDTSPWPCFVKAESPLHTVYLDPYEISKYEVTNVQYRACVDAGECRRPRYSSADGRGNYFYSATYDYYPVIYVAWQDAHSYCEWAGLRLPTEAEWEKAARGDGDTRTWPWGNEAPTCDELSNLEGKNCGRPELTDVVGAYPKNVTPYGVFDMSGNIYEWVYDKYDDNYYRYTPYANPTGPEESNWYAIRGGSYRGAWEYRMINHRKSGHYGDIPLFRSSWVGFRCARSVDPAEVRQ